MKINAIELYNIGSYEGINVFDIAKQSEDGEIVLVGGKNGAGKTTVFTSIKLCLYGYKELGYSSLNAYYKNKIKKLVNDRAKVESNPRSHVKLCFSIMNGHDWDSYVMKRSWNLNETPFEELEIAKNGELLSEDEVNDFENYLLNLIPPQLFALYFFDGEEIADFFLDEKNTSKLKEAFLTLCGYDTFDLLYKYFRKMARDNSSFEGDYVKAYLDAEDVLYVKQKELSKCEKAILEYEGLIDNINSDLLEQEREYKKSGGLSISEWKSIFSDMKGEEHFREEKNLWLKNAANEKLSFIILREELEQLQEQVQLEKEMDLQESILSVVNTKLPHVFTKEAAKKDIPQDIIESVLEGVISEIEKSAINGSRILNLSKEEFTRITGSINSLLTIDKDEIVRNRKAVNDSIARGKKAREEMSESSIEGFELFSKQKEELLDKKAKAYDEKEKLLRLKSDLEQECAKCKVQYAKAEKEWEKALKSESVTALTGKTIRFLEKLQGRLYESEKKKVEDLFMYKMNQLMRKNHFIDKIVIGDDFEIHVYKRIVIECKGVCDNIRSLGIEAYQNEYGLIHCEDILRVTNCDTLEKFAEKYYKSDEIIDVMLEFDKSIMSKGEKQVFIMSLYWAIMQLCNKDIPFIIDTPFARIDTEHRAHITEKFFKELTGQVFIFSTDEEITKEHIKVIGDDLQAKFLIENTDNKKTTIREKTYFEV